MVNNTQLFECLSLREQTAVTQLKQIMIDCISEEMYEDLSVFIRFLRARGFNVNAAEVMLRNHLEWRRKNQVESILTDYVPKEVLQKYLTINNIGIDKEGSPVVYFHIGGLDSRGILKSCRRIDIVKFVIQFFERNAIVMKEQSIKLNKPVDKWTMIFNVDNVPLSVASHKETLELFGQIIAMYDANYPERLKAAFLINGALYFSLGYAVVKHFIPEETCKKIRVYGHDGWLNDVLDLVPEDILPAFLGGKRTDPDGNRMCKTFITHGGLVDESYYFSKKEQTIANLPNAKKLTVTRMSKTRIPFNVTEPDTYLEWEFETKNRDIAFSLLYKHNENDSNLQELIPKQRIETETSSEIGTIKCQNAGIYIIEFDNSFSWIFTKEIYYRVSIVKK